MSELAHEVESRKQFTGDIPDAEDIIRPDAIGTSRRLISERKVNFTHDLATKILQLAEFTGERGLRNKHVEYLISCMLNGTFMTSWVRLITAFCVEDGKDYRCNGQHTCWARLELPEDWEHAGQVTVEKYECQTVADVRILYSMIDRGAPRTRAHVTHAYMSGSPEFSEISAEAAAKLPAGLAFWLWEKTDERGRHDPSQVATLILGEHLKLSQEVGGILSSTTSRAALILRRSPVIGSMFATCQKSISDSKEFWARVMDGVGMASVRDPRLLLHNELVKIRLSRSNAGNKVVTHEELYRICIHAWNAWRRGDELKSLRGSAGGKRPAAK